MANMLLPCPFCAGTPKHIRLEEPKDSPNWGGEVIECQRCGASSAVVFPQKCPPGGYLQALWNRRKEDSPDG